MFKNRIPAIVLVALDAACGATPAHAFNHGGKLVREAF